MTAVRHELTEDWSEVMGLTEGTTYRCWLVGAWRPAFISTGMNPPAANSGIVGAVLHYRERLAEALKVDVGVVAQIIMKCQVKRTMRGTTRRP